MTPASDSTGTPSEVADAWERLRRTARAPSPPVDQVSDHRGEPGTVRPDGAAGAEPVLPGVGRHAIPTDWTGPLRAVAVVAVVAIVVAGALFWRAAPRVLDDRGSLPSGDSAAHALSDTPATVAATGGAQLVVHVVGAVRRPGVVRLSPGARVADAVHAAGGLRPGVRADSLNLARPVTDGEQVLVGEPVATPAAQAGQAQPRSGADTARLDLNAANASELEELDGVGPVLAARIVAWRTEHGRFASVDQLQEVTGIGPKIFDGIKSQVTT